MDHWELVVAPSNWQDSAAPACLASSAINVCGTANMRFILFLSIFNTRMWQMYLFSHVCAKSYTSLYVNMQSPAGYMDMIFAISNSIEFESK